MSDAVVIGAGHNGLVAANLLADEGWDVVVLEAQPEPGGAVRSGELTRPGWIHDRFSAFYPLAVASPAIRSLELERYGLRWRMAPSALAHPVPGGRAAVLSTDLDVTAASLDDFAPGDGDGWRELYGLWEQVGDALTRALLGPFPPVAPAARLLGRLGVGGLLRLLRHTLLPSRRMAEEAFAGEGGGLLLAGSGLHADMGPDDALGGFFGWLLCCLGQQVGFPVPEGGSGCLIDAMVHRLTSRGGRVECGAEVTRIVVRKGTAVAVTTADGREFAARRAVLADVGAPDLYRRLVGEEHIPPRLVDDLDRFQYDNATVKVDWALSGPVPWEAEGVGDAGTVHVSESVDAMARYVTEISCRRIPARPYLIVGQMTTTDPTRSPPGTETLWAYTHVPQDIRGDAAGELEGLERTGDVEAFADRMESEIERYAPGFRDLILDRYVASPRDLEAADANLVGGAINGGTSRVHQQLVFRPVPNLARPATAIRRLYLASAYAHPGGGVHGAPGANAARAALARERGSRVLAAGAVGATAAALSGLVRR